MAPLWRRPRKSCVALLAEGVDRNTERDDKVAERNLSPSSRRAWIEIRQSLKKKQNMVVALLAEGVDRNTPSLLRSA